MSLTQRLALLRHGASHLVFGSVEERVLLGHKEGLGGE